MLFVALEVFSLPLLWAAWRRLISQEAAMKYFLLGAFSSAFLLFGIALLYGFAGTMSLGRISNWPPRPVATPSCWPAPACWGSACCSRWAPYRSTPGRPDVYQGAPTPVTGFMAACTKIAAFIGLMRVFYVALGGTRWDWAPMMWIVAILTMVVGSIVAITQTDVKRMLAYSSIAHAGFLLTAFIGLAQSGNGITTGITSTQAVLFYLVTYGFPTIGAFAVVTLVQDAGGEPVPVGRAGKKSPLLAGIFAFFLLSFAGIPLTAGFTGKWAVFSAAWTGGAWPLVVVAVLCSLIAAFFYVRVIVLMFFSDLPADAPDVALPGWQTTSAVALGLAATVVLGLVPGPVLDLASESDPVAGREPGIRVRRRGARNPGSCWAGDRRAGAARRSRVRGAVRHRGGAARHGCRRRFRPLLVLLGSEFGPSPAAAEVVKAAVVVELTHVATLHHDDVMDEAALRRARPPRTPAGTTRSPSCPATGCSPGRPTWSPISGRRRSGSRPAPSAGWSRARSARPSASVRTRTRWHYLSVVADKTGSLIATSVLFGARYAGASEEIKVVAGLRRGDRCRLPARRRHPRHRLGVRPVRQAPAPTCAKASPPSGADLPRPGRPDGPDGRASARAPRVGPCPTTHAWPRPSTSSAHPAFRQAEDDVRRRRPQTPHDPPQAPPGTPSTPSATWSPPARSRRGHVAASSADGRPGRRRGRRASGTRWIGPR